MSTSEIESLKKHFTSEISKMEKNHRLSIASVSDQRAKDMKDIMLILKPMSDTYNTANTAARWLKKFLVFLGIVLGIVISIKKLTSLPE